MFRNLTACGGGQGNKKSHRFRWLFNMIRKVFSLCNNPFVCLHKTYHLICRHPYNLYHSHCGSCAWMMLYVQDKVYRYHSQCLSPYTSSCNHRRRKLLYAGRVYHDRNQHRHLCIFPCRHHHSLSQHLHRHPFSHKLTI